jgi:prepilin-type N-terminal cleavage/methylation domain-containing protein
MHVAAHPVRGGFTLLELLVVMGILLILATLTAISVGKVTRDAKLANATNVLVAALGNARAIAIRDNAYVMVTFRIAPDRRGRAIPREPQVVQVVTARWTGEVLSSSALGTPPPPVVAQFPDDVFADRFIPVPGVPTRDLPAGILVAGPAFGFVTDASPGQNDQQWRTQPRFAGTANLAVNPPTYATDATRTELGWAIGVLFGPDGRVLSRNPEQVLEVVTAAGGNQNAYVKAWVDIDGDGYPRKGAATVPPFPANANVQWFVYKEPTDEPLVDLVPYLAVFNDAEARERFPNSATSWRGLGVGGNGTPPARIADQSLFIDEQSDRITFNRFTGVPGIVPK